MSEAMNTRSKTSRFHLLATVSSIALISSALGAGPAIAAGSGEPFLWIEMGVQYDRVKDSSDNFMLPIGTIIPPGVTGPLPEGLDLSRGHVEDGKLTFQPRDSDWVFSAGMTYGRSSKGRKFSQLDKLPNTTFVTYHTTIPTYPRPYHKTFSKPLIETGNSLNGSISSTESHFVIDFSAGKDVGLGMFGHDSTSVLSAGVRYANFTSKLNLTQAQGVKDIHFTEGTPHVFLTSAIFPPPTGRIFVPWYHTFGGEVWRDFDGSGRSSHDFMGIGPSISWDASVPFAGHEDHGGEFSFDWGANAAVLFGKQKNKVEHRSSSSYNCYGKGNACHTPQIRYAPQGGVTKTSKSVIVPNLGGSVGISYRIRNFKASFGYKADYFFRAIDTGVTGQHAVTRNFQGPYVSVSVGIGDR